MRTIFAAGILLVMIALVYGQALNFSYTAFDDDAILMRNAERIDSLSAWDVLFLDAEFTNRIDLYRPLANLSYWIDFRLFGHDPGGFHLAGLLIHWLVSLLIYLIVKSLSGKSLYSLIPALLFAVHPLFNITVAWLPARGDLLLALFSLLAFFSWLVYLQRERPFWLVSTAFCYILALFSKENAVVLPFLLAAYSLLISRKPIVMRKMIVPVIIAIAGTAAYFWLRSMAIRTPDAGTFGLQAWVANLPMIPETLYYFVLPFYVPPMPFYSWFPAITGAMLLLLMAGVAMRMKSGRNLLVFVLLWLVLLAAPAMFYRPPWSSYCYDFCLHRSYLPLASFFFIFAFPPIRLNRRKSTIVSYFWIGLIVILAVFSVTQTRNFRNDLSFYTLAAERNPSSALVWQNLGNAHYNRKQYIPAEAAYNKALELKPDFSDSWLNKGVLNMALAEPDYAAASAAFQKVLEFDPDNRKAYEWLARSRAESGNWSGAAEVYTIMTTRGWSDAEVWYNSSLAWFKAGDYGKSLDATDNMLKKYPDDLRALRLRAHLLHRSVRNEEAAEAYLKILRSSKDAEDHSNLGFVYHDLGKPGDASAEFDKAIAADSNYADAWLGRALVLEDQGKRSESEACWLRAVQLLPVLGQGKPGIKKLREEMGYYFSERQLMLLEKLSE
mgnify:FL=1